MAWLDTAKKFRGLHIREVEVAALATALLWEEVAKQNLLDAEMSAMRDACYEEFHANVIKEYGPVEGGIRIVKLLCLSKDITILTSLYAELFLMSSIFGPDNVGTEATT
ncbi:hypothetical protein AAVH_05525 [Aphelenchoides avenae]|nr:hypothetical protein AAVH_05525 [Aphelenchus avenae]